MEAKEKKPAGMGAGDGFGHGGQGFVDLAVVLESAAQDLYLQGLSLVPASKNGARQGQVAIDGHACFTVL
jgi:hypothetical protein